MPPPAERD